MMNKPESILRRKRDYANRSASVCPDCHSTDTRLVRINGYTYGIVCDHRQLRLDYESTR